MGRGTAGAPSSSLSFSGELAPTPDTELAVAPDAKPTVAPGTCDDLDLDASDYRRRYEELLRERAVEMREAASRVRREADERRQAEAEALASEERFRILVEHSSDLVLIVDAHATIAYCSPRSSVSSATARTRSPGGPSPSWSRARPWPPSSPCAQAAAPAVPIAGPCAPRPKTAHRDGSSGRRAATSTTRRSGASSSTLATSPTAGARRRPWPKASAATARSSKIRRWPCGKRITRRPRLISRSSWSRGSTTSRGTCASIRPSTHAACRSRARSM